MDQYMFGYLRPDLLSFDKVEILEIFSGRNNIPAQYHINDFKAYFAYVLQELKQSSGLSSKIGIETFNDLNKLVSHIRDHRTLPRGSDGFYSFFPMLGDGISFTATHICGTCNMTWKDRHQNISEEQRANAIQLAVQLWLGLTIQAPQLRFKAGTSKITWSEEQSLDQLVAEVFDRSQPGQAAERFPRSINVKSLEQVAGIYIVWTENLADHLRLTDDAYNPTIKLFRFPALLQLYAESGSDSVLPLDLLEETLQTFALLIPCYSVECKKWFDRACRKARQPVDSKARDQTLNDQGRNLAKYKYWGERLSIIKEIYDESEPKSFSQWWHDRRSSTRWYSFWGAVVLVVCLTMIFGITSSVTGVMQVWAAYHPRPDH